ncbi:efflux transporter outer membrane subunit [Caballeronia sp. LZ034LL]|uniref:efflux transporter outer membrane subunit n=1 Tax=Caballeronia sp. LZ034LL TaxID=3038567 RepID=UPI002859E764|nr:efflux transporter outer membrane subunit [Caballeronia sp. LZ034LL]MDR5835119.1 efflux transporter outer membrane subunit [Caballeronia sp. LZ034LL]
MLKRSIAACVAAGMVSACSFAPVYHAPETAIPASFKEAGPWRTAAPADRIVRDGWWKMYKDPVLDELEARVDQANPDVAAAVARHDEAEGFVQQARAGLFPTIGSEASVSRQRQSDNRPLRGSGEPSVYDSASADVGIGYDLDLWGKVRNEVKAGRANAQASADDLQSLRLSLQASLADHYFQLRGLDERTKLLQDTIVTYQHALALTESRHAGGIASGMDVSRARTQLSSAQAAVDDTAASRALLEHAIATLTGTPASSFSLAAATPDYVVPQIPVGVPSQLLQRRPDIAAAERRVAAANANIGVAKAAFFPDVTLGLDGGYQSDTFSPWLAAPDEIWSIGPQLMFTLFDGGRRRAAVAVARAKLAENGAKYRETVLAAFQQVEDELALLHHLGDASRNEDEALASAQSTLALAMSRYRDGAVSYLNVVTAQTTALHAQISSLDLRTRRLTASVGLIQALGGGWS